MNKMLSNFLFLIFFLLSHIVNCTFATTLIEFDDPHLIIVKSKNKISGYYNSTHPILHFSCVFLFETEKYDSRNDGATILSFYTRSTFQNRNTDDDIKGNIYLDNDSLVINLENQHGGCDSAAGWDFRKRPLDENVIKFEIAKRSNALGLATVVTKKSYFHKCFKGVCSPQKPFLTNGDMVILLKTEKDFSFVKFINSRTTKVSTGWLKSTDLVNPYSFNI